VSVSPVPAPSLLSGRRGGSRGGRGSVSVRSTVWDFVGGDLVRPDLGKWLDDVEKHKALAIYPPHEGGYEGRYLNRLRYQGYYFLDLSARGLGDPETTLTKVHPVCPVRSTPLVSFFLCLLLLLWLCRVLSSRAGTERSIDELTRLEWRCGDCSLASAGSRWRGGTSRRRWTTGSACCTRTPKASSSGSSKPR
jgi:hypothetical protein